MEHPFATAPSTHEMYLGFAQHVCAGVDAPQHVGQAQLALAQDLEATRGRGGGPWWECVVWVRWRWSCTPTVGRPWGLSNIKGAYRLSQGPTGAPHLSHGIVDVCVRESGREREGGRERGEARTSATVSSVRSTWRPPSSSRTGSSFSWGAWGKACDGAGEGL